jgi:hypothetical protein
VLMLLSTDGLITMTLMYKIRPKDVFYTLTEYVIFSLNTKITTVTPVLCPVPAHEHSIGVSKRKGLETEHKRRTLGYTTCQDELTVVCRAPQDFSGPHSEMTKIWRNLHNRSVQMPEIGGFNGRFWRVTWWGRALHRSVTGLATRLEPDSWHSSRPPSP